VRPPLQEGDGVKSVHNIGSQPASVPVVADEVLEFHAARLLMLLKLCGVAGRIEGLTKLAKLDFFVRYPQFFETVARRLGKEEGPKTSSVESSMIRHHYGPWDKRYYHILAYLKAKGLITVSRERAYQFKLTDVGKTVADTLAKRPAFAQLAAQMSQVKAVLGNKAGSTLKNLVYETFDKEVAQRPLGEVIE
jgi:hypothetical protein